MTPEEEAKAHVAEQDTKLKELETEIERLFMLHEKGIS